MKKKAQPQFAKGNAAHRQKRMRPTNGLFKEASEESRKRGIMLDFLTHAFEESSDDVEVLLLQNNRLDDKLIAVRKERMAADSALQSYVSSFDALKTNLMQVLDSHALLTRSQVVERIKELIK
jgi:hypothetical protein